MKAIHKFNGGRGATLCNCCNVIITEGNTDDLLCDKCETFTNQRVIEELEKYRDRWKSQMDAIPTMVDVKQGKAKNVSDIKRYQMEGLAQAWYELRERIKELKQK